MLRFEIILLCICIGSSSKATADDPCKDYSIMDDVSRSASKELPMGAVEKCDRILKKSWYRLKINGPDADMATTCVDVFYCGSTRPIWLNSTLPTKMYQKVKGSLCFRGFTECCEEKSEIDIMNCGTYNVYYWTPIDLCQGRYCVAERVKCKAGFSSETGFEPGCKAINITFNEIPRIKVLPINQNLNEKEESVLRFQCKVRVPPKNTGNVFDIQWYLNGKEVLMQQNISESDLETKGIFNRYDVIKNGQKTPGFKIKCSVRARVFSGATPTLFVESDEFYAGIVVTTRNSIANAGTNVTVQIHSTIPITCGIINNRPLDCNFMFEMLDRQNELQTGQSTKDQFCISRKRTDASLQCGINFDGRNWKNDHNLTIPILANQNIHPAYTAIVKLRLSGLQGRDPLWLGYELPDIKIKIRESNFIPAKCSSVTDPHITTFDGRYYTTFEEGEYVLYKHTEKPIAVHVIHKDHGHAPRWNCAVAVRAGSDTFIVYGCDRRWRQRRAFCDSTHGSYLDVYEKNQGKNFEVHLPTGARVSIAIKNDGNRKYLNVYVDASTLDKEKTAGLCGTFNNNPHDDFTSRIGKVVNEVTFKKDWHVDTKDSLFVAKSRVEVIMKEEYVCSCNITKERDTSRLDEIANCDWHDSDPVCISPSYSEQQCRYRHRRDLNEDEEDDIDVSPEIVAFKPAPPNSNKWKNGWNESAAQQECIKVLHKSEMYQKCKSIIAFNESQSIQMCVEDIKYLGSNQLTSEVDTPIREACLNILRVNETMWQATNTSTAKSSPVTNIVTEILEKDCPNDCSVKGVKQGNCQNGNCSCFANFAGDDCSIDTTKAPEIDASDTDTICDTNKKSCSYIKFFGDNFFNSGSGFKCKLEETKVFNNTNTSGTVHLTDADMISFGEIRCYLPTSRQKRSVSISQPAGFLVSVTTNGNTFSNQLPIIVYDSTCSNCAIINGGISCTEKDDICIVDGQCYSLSSSKCASRVDKEQGKLWIIGAALGGVTFVLIVVLLIVKVINAPRTRTDLVRMPDIPDYMGNKPMNYK